jgi:hypothetical protein
VDLIHHEGKRTAEKRSAEKRTIEKRTTEKRSAEKRSAEVPAEDEFLLGKIGCATASESQERQPSPKTKADGEVPDWEAGDNNSQSILNYTYLLTIPGGYLRINYYFNNTLTFKNQKIMIIK